VTAIYIASSPSAGLTRAVAGQAERTRCKGMQHKPTTPRGLVGRSRLSLARTCIEVDQRPISLPLLALLLKRAEAARKGGQDNPRRPCWRQQVGLDWYTLNVQTHGCASSRKGRSYVLFHPPHVSVGRTFASLAIPATLFQRQARTTLSPTLRRYGCRSQ
jgi:hypothetical protein